MDGAFEMWIVLMLLSWGHVSFERWKILLLIGNRRQFSEAVISELQFKKTASCHWAGGVELNGVEDWVIGIR